ncbi:RecQ family ATP-dependent DNA helicase [Demequina sp. SYSU T00192]|uniref:DNA 3'-5' helicase n=1 Tax=Demequina litoralis TaxID=3051660 RepID=A0ABT8GAP4_9MICO|nr:RecQ family ATP-dependent DNA helicase [Demequina sp. SYSU T00192]MDN4476205.1 RecQ family ATP-dependent DNA helicase [Demequina sp. SYSU T00192]
MVPEAAPVTAASSLRDDAEAALRRLVGREDAALRDDQWTAVDALVSRHERALVVQRTGWGKSAVYFVATRLLRDRGAGPTVIVSPLLALMRDQITAAARAGIRAATVNSANVTEWGEVHAAIARGEIDVLLCSPERLNNPAFRDEVLPRLAADAGLVVIDEAHCISDWGHDFRPDYRRIRTLLADLPAGIPVLATTATANARVTADVAEQLGVTGSEASAEVLVLRGPLDRESLHLAVLDLPDPAARVAWLAQSLGTIKGSGIVYCLTVSAAEEVASQLRAAGLEVAAYTGQTDPAERERLEGELKDNRVKALVATSALGMGFDKPDLAFVVHLGAPSSPIAYYQQVGRAGRGVDRAVVVLLPGKEDRAIWEWFGSQAFPPEETVRATLAALATDAATSIPALEARVDLRRSRLEAMLKVLDVDGAVKRVQGGWIATGEPWSYDAERYARVAAARRAEESTMLAYQRLEPGTAGACRMAFLRGVLDDPELADGWACGRCDACGGVELPEAPSVEAVEAAQAGLDRVGVEVVARRQWPTGLGALGLDLRGRIPADEQAAPGRAVARLDGLGWSVQLRELLESRDADGALIDGETPVPLRSAAVRVLQDWEAIWDGDTSRTVIDGVVAVRSASRPVLVDHLARGLARWLQVPFVGAVAPVPGREAPERHDVNSAIRLAGVVRRLGLELEPSPDAGEVLAGQRVLLVDDLTDSGWTLTVASRLLRRAGAEAVHPFVLGVR